MAPDPIVEETRAIRAEFAKQHHYDVEAIVQALHKASEDARRHVVSLPPKPVPEDERTRKAG